MQAFPDPRACPGFETLVGEIFGLPPLPPWPGIALFDDARCVAGLQCGRLRVAYGDGVQPVAALRNVCVAPDRRGRGLMRALMEHALAQSDAAGVPTLLYAEEAALYERFGFEPLAQHAFEGPAPAPEGHPAAGGAVDEPLLRRLVGARARVSHRCDLAEDGGLRLARLLRPAADWRLRSLTALDALVAVEWDGDTLVLVDLVAASIPSAGQVLGALGERPGRLRTLFPPDLLGWTGAPVLEDAGLMVRGALPSELRRSVMLPPTVEF